MAPKKGSVPWNKGMSGHLSDESVRRISKSQKKRFKTEVVWNKGKILKPLSKEHLIKISGENHHNWGKVMSQKTREKISITKIGNKNPMWRGGIYPIAKNLRTIGRYNQWRISVFEKDSYSCVICNKKGGKLNADHIEPFSFLLRKYYIKTTKDAIGCDNLWDILNGRTLCEECHRKTETFGFRMNKHRKYGKK